MANAGRTNENTVNRTTRTKPLLMIPLDQGLVQGEERGKRGPEHAGKVVLDRECRRGTQHALNAELSPRPCIPPPTLRSTFIDNRIYDSGSSTPRATFPARRIADIENRRRRHSS